MQENIKLGFGGKFIDEDPRNYKLENVGTAISIPDVYLPDYSHVSHDYQGKQPQCGPHAGSMLNTLESSSEASARYLTKKVKSTDGHPIEDGTDINSLLKAMCNFGTCRKSMTGNDVTLSLVDYVNLQTTVEMDINALAHRYQSYAIQYNPTFEQIKRSIFLNRFVILLMRVGQNMYRPSWDEKDIMPLNPRKYEMDSGHFVLLVGYDEKYIYFRNSWGDKWARKGDGYFAEEYISWINAIGTVVDRSQVTSNVLPQFTKDLSLGMTDIEVKNLQIFLNNHNFPVASSGVGSKGKETKYFGALTEKALIAYQKSNGIQPAEGYFGVITRTRINMVIASI